MSIGTVLGILGFVAIGYWYYTNLKSKNPISLNRLAEDNVELLFKSLSGIGTIIEVINLGLIAMENMQLDLFQAMSRYILIGAIEILTSFVFIGLVSNSLKVALEDGKVTFTELIKILFNSIPIFIISFWVTGYIHTLYLESIYQVEGQHYGSGFWSSTFPIFATHYVSDPNMYELISPEWRKPVSLASLFLIYTTTIFDLMVVYFLWRKYKKEYRDSKKKKAEDEKDTKKKKKNEEKKDLPPGLQDYLEKIELWLGIKPEEFLNWLYNYIGMDLSTGQSINHAITDKDVVSGKVKPKELLVEVTETLVGHGDKGLSALMYVTDDISKMVVDYKNLQNNLDKLKKEREEKRKKSEPVGDITVDINSLEKDKIPNLKADIQDELDHRDTIKTSIIDTLKTLNCKIPSHNEKFIKEVNDVLK